MHKKKTEQANIEKRRKGFFYIGLVISLALSLLAFEWVISKSDEVDIYEPMVSEETPWVVVIDSKKIPEKPLPNPAISEMQLLSTGVNKVNAAKFTNDLNNRDVGDIANTKPWIDDEDIFYIDPFPGKITKSIFDIDQRPHYNACLGGGGYTSLVYDCTVEQVFKYVRTHIKVPECVKLSGGKQIVMALVKLNEKGRVADVSVLNSDAVCEDCSIEAMRVLLQLPPMNPGIYGGMNISVSFSIPIKFEYR
ncbi:energy transducer TonB [Flavobacteriales bacterium]|nr:energy transducer TonB [Flavobacteriales bacterium]MDG2331779.1 energy transducer TonB [Flavobacteriales bacterium]